MAQYQIIPRTPVHIGNGISLSHRVDYIIDRDIKDNECAWYVDKTKLSTVLQERNLQDAFEDAVFHAKPLTQFIKETNIKAKAIAKSDSIFIAIDDLNDKEFRQFIHTNGKVYLPGTTVKGAFHNALYYHWLANTKDGSLRLNEIKKKISQEKQAWALKDLNNESKGFTPNSMNSCMKLLSVSDSSVLSRDNALMIDNARRLNVRTDIGSEIPICAEYLDPSLEPIFTLNIDFLAKSIRQIDIPKGFPETEEQVLAQLQFFNRKTIDLMLEKMKSAHRKYSEQLIDIKNEISNGINFIRLGSGKTFHFNTVSALLGREFDLARKNLKKEFGKGSDAFVFPSTISLIEGSHLGWCEIKKIT